MEEKIKKLKKVRKGGFPIVDLSIAIGLLKKASQSGWQMSKETFAKAIGAKTAQSGHFLLKLSALRDFGLLERGSNARFTDLARQLVVPVPDSDSGSVENKNLQKAFLNSGIFNSMYQKIKEGSGESSREAIANSATYDLNVDLKRKDLFAKNFLSSGEYAGLLKDEGGVIKLCDKTNDKLESEGDRAEPQSLRGLAEKNDSTRYNLQDEGCGWQFVLTSQQPLTSEVRKKMIEVVELLESSVDGEGG